MEIAPLVLADELRSRDLRLARDRPQLLSTLAAALAPRLGLPLLATDEIKEALMDALGHPQTVADSQRLGQAAVLAMLRVARRCPGAVLGSTWFDYALSAARGWRIGTG